MIIEIISTKTLENTEGAIQNGQSREMATWGTQEEDKQNKKYNTIFVRQQYTQINTNNVNKTLALLQTTGGKVKPNIVFKRKSYNSFNTQLALGTGHMIASKFVECHVYLL